MAVLAAIGGSLLLADEAEAVDYGAVLSPKDPTMVRFTQPGGEAWFNWTLENTYIYGARENVTLDILGQPPGWSHFLAGSIVKGVRTSTKELKLELSIKETANVSLRMYVSPGANNGSYWMDLSVVVDEDPSVNHSSGFCVVVGTLEPWFGLAQPPTDDIISVYPPANLVLRFLLFNGGSASDRFNIAYNTTRWEEGWVIGPNPHGGSIDGMGWTPELPADPTRSNPCYIDLVVRLPAEAPPNLQCACNVSATSEKGQTPEALTASVVVASLQYYDFCVYIGGADRKEGTPGEPVVFPLRIHNKGNGPDMFTIRPVWDEELNPGFAASVEPAMVEVSSNSSAYVSYIVTVPQSAPRKVYFFTAEVYSSSKHLALVVKQLAVEVGQFFALELTSSNVNASTDPGGVVEFEVLVKNTGNGLDSVKLHLEGVPACWINYTQPNEHSLLQGEEGRSNIRIIVPNQFDKAPVRDYKITVVVASYRSPSTRANLTLRVDIGHLYRIDWLVDEHRPWRGINPYSMDHLDFTLQLKNFGNGEENVTIWPWTPNRELNLTVVPTVTSLRVDEVLTVLVHVTFPREIPVGTHKFYVNATSEDRSRPMKIASLEFDVVNLDLQVPPHPTYNDPTNGSAMRSDLKVLEDTTLSFDLTVRNVGSLPTTEMWVEGRDTYFISGLMVSRVFINQSINDFAVGDSYRFSAKGYEPKSPPILWSADVPGLHKLEFRVLCANQSDVTNDVAVVNVTVEEAPKAMPEPMDIVSGTGIIVGLTVMIVVLTFARHYLLRSKMRE